MGQVPQNRNFWDTLPYFRGEQPANRPPSAGSVMIILTGFLRLLGIGPHNVIINCHYGTNLRYFTDVFNLLTYAFVSFSTFSGIVYMP